MDAGPVEATRLALRLAPGEGPADRVVRVVGTIAGVVLTLVGAMLLAWLAWLPIDGRLHPRPASSAIGSSGVSFSSAVLVMPGLAALAIFTMVIGSRLAWRKPNRDGSVLSPAGWATLAFVFLAATVALGIASVRAGHGSALPAIPGLAAFGLPCLWHAIALRRRARAQISH